MGYDHWESDPVSVVDTTTTADLSAPDDFKVSSVGSWEASVSWDCPPEGCQCVDHYLLYWSASNSSSPVDQTKVGKHETDHVISSLDPCTDYTVTIEAIPALTANISQTTTRFPIILTTTPNSSTLVLRDFFSSPSQATAATTSNMHETTTSYASSSMISSPAISTTTIETTITQTPVSTTNIPQTTTTGVVATIHLTTADVVPGIVQYLGPDQVYEDGFDVRWLAPVSDPQCVASYQTSVSTSGRKSDQESEEPEERSDWHHKSERGLKCDHIYFFSVSAITKSQLAGPWAHVDIFTMECE